MSGGWPGAAAATGALWSRPGHLPLLQAVEMDDTRRR